MLKIDALGSAEKTKHKNLLRARFTSGRAKAIGDLPPGAPYDHDLLAFLEAVLDEILIGSPEDLECIALAVRGLYPAFSAYAARRKKGKAAADAGHRNTLKIIESCFNYAQFSEKGPGWNAYALVCAYDLRICPFCHAHHVNYHVDHSAASVAEQYRIRPPLDHFLPKSSYPYLAVSLGNLIPSCAQCNSSIKSTADPLESALASPHDLAREIKVRFSAIGSIPDLVKGTVDDVRIDLATTDEHSETFVGAFLLRERYQWYRHEIKDLIDRFADHRGIPPTLRPHIPRERYVLGCAAAHVAQRAIGYCLRDIYDELVKGELA